MNGSVWYLDTSAFVKQLRREPESAALRRWLENEDVVSSDLLRTEARRTVLSAPQELRLRCEADAELEVDEDAVQQILFNLVDNACKYAAGPIELDAEVATDTIRLAVRDRGCGIPRAHRRSIFREFDRGDRATSEGETPGVGLGLPLSRALARDLGGELALDPTLTDGARFVLELPR